ncbi:MAG: pyridoxamine 5'-phosphate oxidase family protein [Acidimicrobiia bacterium]|nr:pyridoxamine 5'-phosphate oxidase family protein [Acidimicrobiia bacterium]
MKGPIGELDERFSSEGATPLPWSDVVDVLERSEMFWLTTVRRDGRPHVTPLPAFWLDDALYFCTGPEEQKAKNIEVNPECVLTTGTNTFLSGLDVVVEGTATRVTDDHRLERLAELWESELNWTFDVVDGVFRDRGLEMDGQELEGRGSAHIFAVGPTKILAFAKGESFTQTRFRF